MTNILTKCQSCGIKFQIEYRRLGALVKCKNCFENIIPQILNGTKISSQGWELAYKDFRQLILYKEYRSTISPLLKKWFGYQISNNDSDILITNKSGEVIDMLWLHLKIQDDSDKQYKLYQAAMSLWHG